MVSQALGRALAGDTLVMAAPATRASTEGIRAMVSPTVPSLPVPHAGRAAREIFADGDTWPFSDVQTGIKATTSGRLPDRA
jgi:hypothetical protein